MDTKREVKLLVMASGVREGRGDAIRHRAQGGKYFLLRLSMSEKKLSMNDRTSLL